MTTAYQRVMGTPVPQSQPLNKAQVANRAGGYVFKVDPEVALRRFLTLGSEGGTYYASERELTKENAAMLVAFAQASPRRMLEVIHDMDPRVPKRSTVLFALAVLFAHTSDPSVRDDIRDHLHLLVRTASHLFEWVGYVTLFRGWGRALRKAVAKWYTDQAPARLAYQVVKYRQRAGWTHRDLLRQAHPRPTSDAGRNVVDYAVHGAGPEGVQVMTGFAVIDEFEAVKSGELAPTDASALPWEAIPTDQLRDPEVWRQLVRQGNLPFMATLRNLGRMEANGALNDPGTRSVVVSKLVDPAEIHASKIHPYNFLVAAVTYGEGRGNRGKLTWTPNRFINKALDAGLKQSFRNMEPTGKKILVAIDISGSMDSPVMGGPITAAQGAAVMAMALQAGDANRVDVTGFSAGGSTHPYGYGRGARKPIELTALYVTGRGSSWYGQSGLVELGHIVDPDRRVADVVADLEYAPFGATDASLPFRYAEQANLDYDAVVVITDNETWHGDVHPVEALKRYRRKVGHDVKAIVVAMTATNYSILDPEDTSSLEIVGFDSAAPKLISDFIRGDL